MDWNSLNHGDKIILKNLQNMTQVYTYNKIYMKFLYLKNMGGLNHQWMM